MECLHIINLYHVFAEINLLARRPDRNPGDWVVFGHWFQGAISNIQTHGFSPFFIGCGFDWRGWLD